MPLIDNIGVVPYSAKKGSSKVRSQPMFASAIIEALKTQLVACGWTLAEAIPASATIEYPLGFPFSLGGSGLVGCGGTTVIITTPFAQFRYCPYQPGQTPVGIGCFQFALGATGIDSLANLCTVISATSPYNATLNLAGNVITLTSKIVGPFSNFDLVSADGRFGVTGGNIDGGGYTLESVGSSPYSVNLLGTFGIGIPPPMVVQMNFTLGPSGTQGTVSYNLGIGASEYTVVANPYSFAIFDGVDPFNSLAAFAPCVPTSEGFTEAYCAFVVGPANLTDQLMWGGGPEGQPSTNSLDASPATFADNRRGPGVLCLRATPGFPAFTLNGQPVVIAAYAMLAASRSVEPTVVGKLWDCLVLSNTMVVGGQFETGGRTFLCIASQDGTSGKSPASLLFCIDDNGQPNSGLDGSGGSTDTGGSGAGGGDSPSNPTAPPGSGNGSFTGTCTCSGSPNNHTVSWASGDKFDPSMAGQTLTITLFGLVHPWVSAGGSGDATGTLPVIASVVSPTVLTTTEDLNSSFDGAPYTSP